jgi:hypothetical protein
VALRQGTNVLVFKVVKDTGAWEGFVAATAILDRFLHHAEVIQITGKSYRLRNQARQGSEAEEQSKLGRAPLGSDRSKSASTDEGAQSSKQATPEEGAPDPKQAQACFVLLLNGRQGGPLPTPPRRSQRPRHVATPRP